MFDPNGYSQEEIDEGIPEIIVSIDEIYNQEPQEFGGDVEEL
jgi:hypothetical protein